MLLKKNGIELLLLLLLRSYCYWQLEDIDATQTLWQSRVVGYSGNIKRNPVDRGEISTSKVLAPSQEKV